ncbi:MAG TPA: hypothetical protein VJV23_11575 [Candidatus Polarisedimenticolia bacterium]|nr:hypothetical protein [Candidatus Polarisedimenticolia bacterium]
MSAAILLAAVLAAGAASPEPPRERVDTSWVEPSGRSIRVPAGGDLQEAIDRAVPGDEIVLAAGGHYTGPFRLRRRDGPGWVLIRTDALDRLPPPGGRATPAHARWMARLGAASGPIVSADPGAGGYRLAGLEIAPSPGTFVHDVVQLGGHPESEQDLPRYIVIDRCWLHGDPARGSRRGVALNGAHLAVIGSTLTDFKEVGADSQAVAGWGGPGPFRIANNDLQAAGENILFGGADPRIRGLVPSDIEIVGNRLSKPLAWKEGDPAFDGTAWTVKNLLELKNARRVIIEGNLLERNWAHAQNGFAILLTVRNQDGSAPWSTIEDVLLARNVVRRSGGGVNILGRDDAAPSGRARRISIRNNLFQEIGGGAYGGAGILFQLLRGTADLVIEDNTAVQSGSLIMAEGEPHDRFVFRGNIAPHNDLGAVGTGTSTGAQTLGRYFPGCEMRGNVLPGGPARLYPPGNHFPRDLESVRFVDLRGHRLRLRAGSPFQGTGPGGRDPGADLDTLCAALSTADRPPDCGPDHGSASR